jgi:hypothetical protein
MPGVPEDGNWDDVDDEDNDNAYTNINNNDNL